MRRGQIVSGISAVFNAALVERVRLRAIREAADRAARARGQRAGADIAVAPGVAGGVAPRPLGIEPPMPPDTNLGGT